MKANDLLTGDVAKILDCSSEYVRQLEKFAGVHPRAENRDRRADLFCSRTSSVWRVGVRPVWKRGARDDDS